MFVQRFKEVLFLQILPPMAVPLGLAQLAPTACIIVTQNAVSAEC